MKRGSFFEGELYPEDVLWIESQINLPQHERDAIAARIAHSLGKKSLGDSQVRAEKVGRSLSRQGKDKWRVSGRQLSLNIGAGNGSLYPLTCSKTTTKREHCFYCGGPIDRPGAVLPDGFELLLGVKLGESWYHRDLCLARHFKIG